MLLRNHGTLTVGRSVASAFERMYHLERACTMQVRTRMLGPDRLSGRSGGHRQERPAVRQSRPRRNCVRPTWFGRRCCASSIASTPATGIEICAIQCSIARNDLCTSKSKRRPIPGGVFAFLRKPLERFPVRLNHGPSMSCGSIVRYARRRAPLQQRQRPCPVEASF